MNWLWTASFIPSQRSNLSNKEGVNSMELFGSTRSRVERNHALICPDSFVRAPLPGWTKTQGIVLIAPRMGARFSQYMAIMEPGAESAPSAEGIERVVFVLEGALSVELAGAPARKLLPGGYLFVPAGQTIPMRADSAARINVFEKRFVSTPGLVSPQLVIGQEQGVDGVPFLGDANARLQVLLPDLPGFDIAVNRFRFQPGAALPLVEIHVMEHGLLMLEGQGIYRLGDNWYPVQAGDVIWMAPYCPQWFVAMGKEPACYLYYKDVNRDPLAIEARQ
jgi:(S)-ureidoglycine aminohydrolase